MPASHVRITIHRPPPGKHHLVVPVDAQLVDRVGKLEPNGHYQTELAELLERTIVQFFRTRPINAGATNIPGSIKLFDPRDPRKDPVH